MIEAPKLSVVMSVYNGGSYLSEAIESVLNQTHTDFEFIIINDGSTDASLIIIETFKNIDPRIILISRENRGLVFSLNEGIKMARGGYIARMDADDISLPTRFEEQIHFFNNNPDVGVCGTWIEVFGDHIKSKKWKLSCSDESLKAELLFSSCFAHPSVMFNKNLLVENIKYDVNFPHAEDFELWQRLSTITKFANINKVLLRYRVLNTSITRKADNNETQRYEVISNIHKRYLERLKMRNLNKENRLHFYLSVNTRIRDNSIQINDLDAYFNKIIIANKCNNVVNEIELKKVLGKKWLRNLLYKKELKAVFSKYFYFGVLGFVKDC
jgi:glycosyltransferase involved in cell wall biosynthesis